MEIIILIILGAIIVWAVDGFIKAVKKLWFH